MRMKWPKFIQVKLNAIRAQGVEEGYMRGREFGRDEAATLCEYRLRQERVEAYNAGRDFEFKTINDHMQGMFSLRMTENVDWVVQRFREYMSKYEQPNPVVQQHDTDIPANIFFNERSRKITNFIKNG